MASYEFKAPDPSRKRKREEQDAGNGRQTDDNKTPKLVVLYTPGGCLPWLQGLVNQVIEVRVSAKFLTTRNLEVERCQIWGTDTYTDDSDPVAMMAHTGKVTLRSAPPTGFVGLSVYLRVLPACPLYKGSLRFGLRSHDWIAGYSKFSLSVLGVEPTLKGSLLSVSRGPDGQEIKFVRMVDHSRNPAMKRSVLAKRKNIPNIPIIYDSTNEPCLKYSLDLVKDRGMSEPEWTSARLRKEVMYFEAQNPTVRYELARERDQVTVGKFDQYRWSRITADPAYLPRLDIYTSTAGAGAKRKKADVTNVPREASAVQLLEPNLDWEEIVWGAESVRIRGQEYPIFTAQFKPRTT